MTERENITDILCIGCQKGSTSWLHSVLNCHRRTSAFPDSEPITSTSKEAHFWDRNHDRGIDWYRGLMEPSDPNNLTMDFTPEYAYMSDAEIAECKELNPSAKVIYILRDPLARALSTIRMRVLWHFGKSYDQTLKLDETFYSMVKHADLQAHGDYVRNVTAWRKHYPDLVLFNYEDFHTDSRDSIGRLFESLGLDVADLDPERRAKFEDLTSGGRVWASEPFPISRPALQFLNGLTWRFRQEADTELSMRFTEGERMLQD